MYPAFISNLIWEIEATSDINYIGERIAENIDQVHCQHIQIQCYFKPTEELLLSIYAAFAHSNVKGIELFISFNQIDYQGFIEKAPRVVKVIVYDSPPGYEENSTANLHFITPTLSKKSCGVVSHVYFATNVLSYTESLHHNSCLNRKISIDAAGNIKNCPSMKESFGNIRDTTLAEAIEKPGFKKYWNITKDQITKCKDCEFRYICTDCRAYRENPLPGSRGFSADPK